ncbi:MAG: hypothetical protein Q7J98_03925 [Kiritimatiellia bacterium]|nr:hypothetical protein [Kiritimatiellia bacterium]
MINKKIIVAGDGHFHLYPCYEPARAISNLIDNLDLLAESARGLGQEEDVFKIAFLVESKQHDYFHKILKKEIDFRAVGFEVSAGPEEHCVSFSKQGKFLLAIVAGRQIVTNEKLEILGLGMDAIVPDGLPAEEAVEKVIAAGGLPVLAFSPGKWLFKRANIVRRLAQTKFPRPLLIGDSALRPLGWGAPEIMRQAGAHNIAVLPGSDPLPLPGDEKYAGCYGFVYQGFFDASKPLASIKGIIADHPGEIFPAGKRCSMVNVVGRLFRLRRNVECRMQNAE